MTGKETETQEQDPKMPENLIIDVDEVIGRWNAANPTLKPMTRKRLAAMARCNTQIFSDWKKTGLTPVLVSRLLLFMEIGNCQLTDFVKQSPNGK
jgi:hypothetical protein